MTLIGKAVFAVPFVAGVYFLTSYFTDLAKSYLTQFDFSNNVLFLLCRFELLESFNIFLSMIALSFVFKSLLSYIKT